MFWFRWLACLPSAALVATFGLFLGQILVFIGRGKYPVLVLLFIEHVILPFSISLSFVVTGAAVAPAKKQLAAAVLFFIWGLTAGIWLIKTFAASSSQAHSFLNSPWGLDITFVIAGIGTGLLLSRMMEKSNPVMTLDLDGDKV